MVSFQPYPGGFRYREGDPVPFPAKALATKTLLDLTHPTWAIPAPLVALLLN